MRTLSSTAESQGPDATSTRRRFGSWGACLARPSLLAILAALLPACGGGGGGGGGVPLSWRPFLWGNNQHGQLGNGRTMGPVRVTGLPASPVTSLDAGEYHSIALHQDGTVSSWGDNFYGQLGIGSTTDSFVPVTVAGLPASPIVAIVAGRSFCLVAHQDGTVSSWGFGSSGQLGDGTTTSKTLPVSVVGLPASPVIAVAAGESHSLALHQSGTVSAWGRNATGQLGNGTTADSALPVTVIGLPASPVIAIAAGRLYSLALHQDGSVSAWGSNIYGELGDGTTTNRSTPVSVIGFPASPVTALAADWNHTLARHQDGTVSSWGQNWRGQLGDGTTTNSSTPRTVLGLPVSPVVVVAVGWDHSIALHADGALSAWGNNLYGQQGDWSTYTSLTARSIAMPFPVSTIGSGGSHSLAVHPNGVLSSWGDNLNGQLGNGKASKSPTPQAAIGLPLSPVTHIAAGRNHSLALHDNGVVSAWGYNFSGNLGDGTLSGTSLPVAVVSLPSSPVFALAAGWDYSLAAHEDGSVSAWGNNLYGQLGNGTTTPSATPVAVTGLPASPVVAIAAGRAHSMAILQNGSLMAWGWNWKGQVGDGTMTDRSTAAVVNGLPPSPVIAVSGGEAHTLAVHQNGAVTAWGWNVYGQIGDGTTTDRLVPVTIAGLPLSPVVSVAAGRVHSLALHQDGTVSAWGLNGEGQLGDGTITGRPSPVSVIGLPPSPVIAVAAGQVHSVALHQDGSMSTWGKNPSGQLGDGTFTTRLTPVTVINLPSSSMPSIAAGSFHTLGLRR